MVARALADESGDLEFVGAVMDITRRKRAEEAQRVQEREREEMQRQLQQAAKMEAIGRLAGGIAHDFNNILGAILGYGELAQNNLVEGGAVRRQIDQVMQAGARGKALVDRILAFSRSGMGERVQVQSVVEETLAELGYEPVGFDSSVAALQAFRAEPKRFDLVLTDETMPDLTGTELAHEIRQLRPEISIILMSGYSGAQLSERAQAAGVMEVLRKPLVRRDIAEPIARALHASN